MGSQCNVLAVREDGGFEIIDGQQCTILFANILTETFHSTKDILLT